MSLSTNEARDVLMAIVHHNYFYLSAYPEFQDYLRDKVDTLDLYLIDLVSALPLPLSPIRANWQGYKQQVKTWFLNDLSIPKTIGLTLDETIIGGGTVNHTSITTLAIIQLYYQQLGIPPNLNEFGELSDIAPEFDLEVYLITSRYISRMYRFLWDEV